MHGHVYACICMRVHVCACACEQPAGRGRACSAIRCTRALRLVTHSLTHALTHTPTPALGHTLSHIPSHTPSQRGPELSKSCCTLYRQSGGSLVLDRGAMLVLMLRVQGTGSCSGYRVQARAHARTLVADTAHSPNGVDAGEREEASERERHRDERRSRRHHGVRYRYSLSFTACKSPAQSWLLASAGRVRVSHPYAPRGGHSPFSVSCGNVLQ